MSSRREPTQTRSSRLELDRREFVILLGAGLLVSLDGEMTAAQELPRQRGARGTLAERLHIGTDGRITVMTGKVEVGQGSRTQITMAAAEELGARVGDIHLIMADSAVVPDDGITAGSRTTPSTIPRVRQACAAARELLRQTAAAAWQVDPAAVRATAGRIVGPGDGRELTFGEIVSRHLEGDLAREIDRGVVVLKVSEWRILGTNVPKIAARELVTGSHRYPSDIVRPGMLRGKILRPPSYGAELEAVDPAPGEALPGVTVVREGDFVGVTAPTTQQASRALRAIARTARWKEREHPSSGDLFRHLKERAAPAGRGGGRRGAPERGSVDTALQSADRVLRASYEIAYIQHAPLEPRAAVAEWTDETLTVWTGTQAPGRVRQQLRDAFRLPASAVRVIVPDTGGGFGGKHSGETAIEAARLARAARKPVSLQWTREEEFTWAYFRPAGLIELAGGLDATGRVIAWEHTNFNSGASAIAAPYTFANTRTRYRRSDPPLRQGSYRALAATANAFARESFIDELAAATGADALEFRLRHEPLERLRAVLEAAARKFDWPRRVRATKDSKTRGVGLACATEKGSYVATCAEVEIQPRSGRYRVVDVCEAFECGAVMNPDNVRAQVAGCILQGLGGALREEIRFRDGRILNPRFARYRVPRFEDVPNLEIEIVDRPDLPAVGAGETPILGIAPAIAGALFAAAGVRIRSLPLRTDHLRPV